jgi:hypothetical protein
MYVIKQTDYKPTKGFDSDKIVTKNKALLHA